MSKASFANLTEQSSVSAVSATGLAFKKTSWLQKLKNFEDKEISQGLTHPTDNTDKGLSEGELKHTKDHVLSGYENSSSTSPEDSETDAVTNKIKCIRWGNEEAVIVNWFLESTDLPLTPFQLKPAVNVLNPLKFYEALKVDIELGPKGPRALFGALQDDLRTLKMLVEDKK